jgi:hypothetical protein
MCQGMFIIRGVRSPLRIIGTEACADNVQDSSGSAHYQNTQASDKEGPPLWTRIQEMAYHDPTELKNRGVM